MIMLCSYDFTINFKVLKSFLVLGFLKTSKVEVAIKAPKLCLLTPEAMTDFYEEAKTAMGLRFILSLELTDLSESDCDS